MLQGTFSGFVRLLFFTIVVVLRGMHHPIYQDRSLLSRAPLERLECLSLRWFRTSSMLVDWVGDGAFTVSALAEKCTQYVST